MALNKRKLFVTLVLASLIPTKADSLIIVGGNAVQPTALPTNLALVNTSGSTQAAHMQGFATAFLDGAVPSGQDLSATINSSTVATQLDCKASYASGACKHGKITISAPSVPGNTTYPITLALAAGGGAPVDLSTLPSSGYTLTTAVQTYTYTQGSGFSTSTLYNIDWMADLSSAISGGSCASPSDQWHGYWRRGPIVTECRVNHDITSSLHAVADIAYFSDGNVWADIQMNNDYAFGGSGGTVFYTETVTQNGSTVVNHGLDSNSRPLTHFQYITRHDIVWKTGTDWQTPNSALNVQGDNAYLKQTGAILPFDFSYNQNASVGGDSAGLTTTNMASKMASSYPTWGGDFPFNQLWPVMGDVGGRPDIGVISGAQAVWLMNWNIVNRDFAIGWAEGAGTIPLHAYDTAHGRYINVSDRSGLYWLSDQPIGQHACDVNYQLLTTNGGTAAGNAVLHFASVPAAVIPGMTVRLLSSPGGGNLAPYPGNRVVSTTSTTVTIDTAATSAMASGDQVVFYCAWEGLDSNGLAHNPELNYVPYLLTGNRHMLDELNAQVAWTVASGYPPTRQVGGVTYPGGDDQLLDFSNQTRYEAWGIGMLFKADWINPAGWLKTYFSTVLDDNLTFAVAQTSVLGAKQGVVYGSVPGDNGMGGPTTYTPPALSSGQWNGNMVGMYQMHYLTSSLALGAGMGYTKARTFMQWMMNFVVGTFLSHTGWDPHDGQQFFMFVADGTNWIQDWATLSSKQAQCATPGACAATQIDQRWAAIGAGNCDCAELGLMAVTLAQYVFRDFDSLTARNWILSHTELFSFVPATVDPAYQMTPN